MKSFLKNWGFPALIALAFVAYVAAERPAGLPLYFTICAAATASVAVVSLTRRWFSERLTIACIVIAVHAVMLSLRNAWGFSPDIGDGRWVIEFASTNTVFPRWLGMSYLTANLYALGKTLTLTSGVFAWLFSSPEAFVRFLLGAIVLMQSLHLVFTTPHLRAVTLVVLSPPALLFFSGHIEIYMVLALYLIQCFETLRSESASPALKGFLIGGLGVLYYGAWHLCLGLLLIAAWKDWKGLFPLLASFVLTLLVGIDLLWPGDLLNFAERLNSYTSTGLRLLVLPYHLHAGRGMFWEGRFLFSAKHLEIVGQIVLFGLVPFTLVLVSGITRGDLRTLLARFRANWRGYVPWIVMLGLSAAFIILMIPRLGIERDVDLFTLSCLAIIYIVASFVGAPSRQLDQVATTRRYALYSVLAFSLLLI